MNCNIRVAVAFCVLMLACDGAGTTTTATTETADSTTTGDGTTGEPNGLFDETGVWGLEQYSLDGTPYQDISAGRKNRFLLRFHPEDGVVAAAACHEMGFETDVNSSSCTNAPLSTWSCQCFSYTYEGSLMQWQEFAPGDTPPVVGDGAHALEVSAWGETAATYRFDSLPAGLFNSDGVISKHVFQGKDPAIWSQVDINADSVLDLEACSMLCFPSEAG